MVQEGASIDGRAKEISALIKGMERILIDQDVGPSQAMDEISCLTEYSMPLSDIHEVGDNGEWSCTGTFVCDRLSQVSR